MKDIYLDLSKHDCKVISNMKDANGSITIPVIMESNEVNLEHKHKIIVAKKQLIKNPNLLQNIADAITGSLTLNDENIVQLELEDFEAVLKYAATTYVSFAEGNGNTPVIQAVSSIVDTPFFHQDVASVLIIFTMNLNYPITELQEAVDLVNELTDNEAVVLISFIEDSTLGMDIVKVLMIYTNKKRHVGV